LLVDILAVVAQLLVEHLVGSAEAEALQTPHAAVGTYQTLEVNGQTSGQAELLNTSGQYALLILLRLAAEQTLGRNADHAGLDAVGSEKLCSSLKGGNL